MGVDLQRSFLLLKEVDASVWKSIDHLPKEIHGVKFKNKFNFSFA